MQDLAFTATEKSTAIVTVTLRDENGEVISAPSITSFKWSLMDSAEVYINDREEVVVATPTNPQIIVLSGVDLDFTEGTDNGIRIILVEALYDSSYGNGLPINAAASFSISELMGV